MSFVGAAGSSSSGSSFSFGELSVSVPEGAQAGDVLVVAAHLPKSEFAIRGDVGRFYTLVSPGADWETLGIVTYRKNNNKVVLAAYLYVIPTEVPDTVTVSIRREVSGVADVADQISLDVAVACYRGVDNDRPFQAVTGTANANEAISFAVLRPPATVVQASVDGVSATLNERFSVGPLRIAEGLEPEQGRSSLYALTADGAAGRLIVALNPAVETPDTDPVPTEGTGVGRLLEPRNPLLVTSDRLQDDVFVADATPTVLGAELVFDALGSCMGGSVLFTDDPLWEPYTRRVQVWFDTADGIAQLYFTAINLETSERGGIYQTTLMELSKLWLDAPVHLDDYPTHVTITETLDLNAGLVVDRIPGTINEFETWRRFLKKRYERVPEAFYGVGAEGRYIQGRPQDAAPLTIDAALYPDPNPIAANLTPYVSEYYVAPNDETASVTLTGIRNDLPTLAPKRIVEVDAAPAGADVPPEFSLPISEPPSYEIVIADRIAIPPFKVVNLPNGETQYVSGARVRITPDTGGGAKLVSTIRTRTLPYPGSGGGQRRDRLGRFA